MFSDIHHFSQLSSFIGSNSCGVDAPITFGTVSVTTTNVSESLLADSTTTEDFDMTTDITDSIISGSVETFGGKWGDGHSFHTVSDSVYGA
jgi:NADH:ubiquinone oxidoreductase subunit F (NADH-binding)